MLEVLFKIYIFRDFPVGSAKSIVRTTDNLSSFWWWIQSQDTAQCALVFYRLWSVGVAYNGRIVWRSIAMQQSDTTETSFSRFLPL